MIVCINANTLGVGEWDLTWRDLAAVNGTIYGVTADGLQVLGASGDLDSAVESYIETGELGLRPGWSQALREAGATLAADDAMTLTVTAAQDGGDRAAPYNIAERSGQGQRERVVRLGRGVWANAWTLRLGGGANRPCNWELNGLRITVDRQRRRRV